jgi:membrane fusion protein, multidrug efflux system
MIPMTLPIRAFVLGTGLLVPLGGCGGRGTEGPLQANTAPKAVTVTIAPLEHRAVDRTVEVVGTLKGWEDVTVGSKRTGRVARVFHDMGDRVRPGELLAALDSTNAALAVSQAERRFQAELAKLGLKALPSGEYDVATLPAVAKARVALERASNNLTRERSLARRNAGTAENLQNAENDEQAAEAVLADTILSARSTLAAAQAARVAVDLAKDTLSDMQISAPVPSTPPPGVTDPPMYAVAKRSVSEGQMIKEAEAVAELVIDNPLRLWANVPERFSDEVAPDQPVRVTVAAHPGTTFEGKVARINPSIDPTTRTFQVEVSVPNNRGLLRPGGFAKASILTRHSADAVVAPIESVVKFAGVTKLFVVEGSKSRSINVETGLEGTGWVEVIGDLPAKAVVVTTGQTQLADGTPVVVSTPEPAKPAPPGEFAPAPTPAR